MASNFVERFSVWDNMATINFNTMIKKPFIFDHRLTKYERRMVTFVEWLTVNVVISDEFGTEQGSQGLSPAGKHENLIPVLFFSTDSTFPLAGEDRTNAEMSYLPLSM